MKKGLLCTSFSYKIQTVGRAFHMHVFWEDRIGGEVNSCYCLRTSSTNSNWWLQLTLVHDHRRSVCLWIYSLTAFGMPSWHVLRDRSIYLSTYLSIYLPTYLSIYLPIYLSIYLSIYTSTHSPIHPSIHPSICPSIRPSDDLSICSGESVAHTC